MTKTVVTLMLYWRPRRTSRYTYLVYDQFMTIYETQNARVTSVNADSYDHKTSLISLLQATPNPNLSPTSQNLIAATQTKQRIKGRAR